MLLVVATASVALAGAAATLFLAAPREDALARAKSAIANAPSESDAFAYLKDHAETLLPQIGIDGMSEIVSYAVAERKLTFAHCHSALHIIGHVSYEAEGRDLNALARYISPACQGAYAHGVEAEIALLGASAFPQLREWCAIRERTGPGGGGPYCYHGAGHEFMRENLGDIESALALCDAIDPERDPGNCWAGVFSEFGALSMGMDNDTGLQIPGEPLAVNPFSPPLEFCERLEEKYHEACTSQLTKTVVNIADPEGSLKACAHPSYTAATREICVRVFGFFYFDDGLTDPETSVPEPVFALHAKLQEAFIRGAMMAFTQATQSGMEVSSAAFCEAFSASGQKAYCLSVS